MHDAKTKYASLHTPPVRVHLGLCLLHLLHTRAPAVCGESRISVLHVPELRSTVKSHRDLGCSRDVQRSLLEMVKVLGRGFIRPCHPNFWLHLAWRHPKINRRMILLFFHCDVCLRRASGGRCAGSTLGLRPVCSCVVPNAFQINGSHRHCAIQ